MAFSLDHIQDAILSHLRDNIPQPVVEISWQDSKQLELEYGKHPHYVSVEFGDVQQHGQRNMASTWNDNHTLPVYFLAVGATPTSVRKLQNLVLYTMLGFTTEYSGEARKRAGGQMFPLPAGNGALEAYCAPVSFGIPIQLADM